MEQSASLRLLPFILGQSGNRVGLLVAFFLAAVVQTATAAEVAVGIGGNVTFAPYKRYDTQWTPLPMIDLDSDYAYIRGTAVGVKICNLDFLEVSIFGAYDATSFNATDTSEAQLRLLHDRDASVAAGMEVRLTTPYGMLRANAARDILGNSNGWNGALSYAYSMEFGPLEIIPTVGVYWSDSRYISYYYGISGQGASKSGLTPHDPGGESSPYLGLTLSHSLTDAWDIFCSGEIVFLGGNIQDSPMVGRSQTRSLTAGIMYTF
ncbi:MAG: MipA/OmpV family protein [Desulfobulbus sp.]|nr:MipA/OmpV family protein [Desulfobulbus sp.]